MSLREQLKRPLWIFLTLGVCVIVFLVLRGNPGPEVTVSSGIIKVSASKDYGFIIYMDNLTDIELRSEFDPGQTESGTDGRYRFGQWKNGEFGEYELCIDTKISNYIVAQTEDTVYVFNYHNSSDTTQFFKAMQKYIDAKGTEGS